MTRTSSTTSPQFAVAARDWWNNWLIEHNVPRSSVDNVAVLFSSRDAEEQYTQMARGLGWMQFNSSRDHVEGHLSDENYDVEFRFLRHDAVPDFRIETMLLNPRKSLIHDRLLARHGQGAIAQGSYKYLGDNSLFAYQAGNAFLNQRRIPLTLTECFQSTYGPYTYWRPEGEDIPFGYLKVRRNARDK